MSCGTMAIMQMRLQQQQDSSNHRNVQIFDVIFCGRHIDAEFCRKKVLGKNSILPLKVKRFSHW